MEKEKHISTGLEIALDNPRSYDELFAMRERDLGYGLPLGLSLYDKTEEEDERPT